MHTRLALVFSSLFFSTALVACSADKTGSDPDLAMPLVDGSSGNNDLVGADLAGVDLATSTTPDMAMTTMLGERLFGGTRTERGYLALASTDGSLYIAGTAASTDDDLAGIKSDIDADIWLLKLDANLAVVWSKTYGSTGMSDRPRAMSFAADGDLVIASDVQNSGKDVTTAYGNSDVWLFKVDATTGARKWETTIGGTAEDSARAVREATLPSGDLEYTVLGFTRGSGGNIVESTNGVSDLLLGKYVVAGATPGTLPSPNPQATTFGGNDTEIGYGFAGELIIGNTSSTSGTDINNTAARGLNDIFVQSPGNGIVRFGGDQHDQIEQVLPDGTFVGRTGSASNEVTCNTHGAIGGVGEMWIGRVDATGLIASTCFGGLSTDEGLGIAKLQSGGYVVVGNGKTGGDITATGSGALVVFLDASLHVTKHYFRPVIDGELRAVVQMANGRIVAIGNTSDQAGVFAAQHGSGDLWLAELTP